MQNRLSSGRVTLRPASMQDKRNIYNWLAHSNLTAEMLGPPLFPDAPSPTWEEFDQDYLDYYFDGSQPFSGRCFIILHNQEEIGQINYNEIDTQSNSTEIDIWLSDRKFTGMGLGTEAIILLCDYLHKELKCKTIIIAPSKRNSNAIKAYKKAGFVVSDWLPEDFTPDYHDAVVMVKVMSR